MQSAENKSAQASPLEDVRRMPFDQYQRYRLVSDVLEHLRQGDENLNVLDVGGRTALLRGFLKRDTISLVDLEYAGIKERMVLGSGAQLPFKDDAFDVVCAFDTLEHVPVPLRAAFVAECARVAKRYVVLAGPYHTEEVARAEELLQRFLVEKLRTHHRYLEEHLSNGLPLRDETEAGLRTAGGEVISIGHGNLSRWLFLMFLAMYLDDDPALRDLAGDLNAFYNRDLFDSDWDGPVYRHLVVGAFGGAPLPNMEALRGPQTSGPKPAELTPFALMSAELAAFDAEREKWREERARFEGVVAHRDGLVAELRASLDAHAAELENHRQANERMRKDLKWPPVRLFHALHSLFRKSGN